MIVVEIYKHGVRAVNGATINTAEHDHGTNRSQWRRKNDFIQRNRAFTNRHRGYIGWQDITGLKPHELFHKVCYGPSTRHEFTLTVRDNLMMVPPNPGESATIPGLTPALYSA